MKIAKIILIGALLLSSSILKAQKEEAVKKGSFQFGFVYPMGTYGHQSVNYSNSTSLNLMIGLNGGVRGFELGGMANINRGYVSGAQVAGMLNLTEENVEGFQLSGIANLTKGSSDGVHIAGVVNLTKESTRGFQMAGVANINGNNSTTTQFGGVANINRKSLTGFQMSCCNIVGGEMKGAQFGVVNISRKLKGFQYGVVNIADTIDGGFALGLINIVKNGYYAVEVSTNEIMLLNLSYKMGSESFYTIFHGGHTRYKGTDMFSCGMGFGTLLNPGKRHQIGIEAVSGQITYKHDEDGINLLNTLKANYRYNINRHMSIYAGPTVNCYVTKHQYMGDYGSINIPNTFYSHTNSSAKTFLWLGLSGGLTYRF